MTSFVRKPTIVIVPDVNLLLYAYRTGAMEHRKALSWWEKALNGSEEIGIPWVVILAFVRIMTNPRVSIPVSRVEEVVLVVRSWFECSNVRVLHPGPNHADLLFRLLAATGTAADLTTDAHIAALAIEYQAIVYSTDTDFARFSGCRWVNPLEPKPLRGRG